MQQSWEILQGIFHCKYKAWQLAKNEPEQLSLQSFIELFPSINNETAIRVDVQKLTPLTKIILTAICYLQNQETAKTIKTVKVEYTDEGSILQTANIRLAGYTKQVQKLITDLKEILTDSEPHFYKNPHCPECQFHDTCYKKLKDRDCISLLASISLKVITKFHKKGIYSITQLSHLFRPRRRRRHPQVSSNYLWELKALAITEKKTFVLYPPDIKENPISIYLDFEGIPEESRIYLIGLHIIQQGEPDKEFSFWANNKDDERELFSNLFNLVKQYPEAPIYHYGSYESKALKQAAKKWPDSFKNEFTAIELRMINLLSFLRTHVYPPIYSNGLKELARYLGFQWSNTSADGLLSLVWRRDWERDNDDTLKDQLKQYNLDDCKALVIVKQWLYQLAINADNENVRQVAEMKKQSIYKFQNNPELGEDFQFISKAAYFDYQRSKIYWRNKTSLPIGTIDQKPKQNQKGVMVWQPKKVNEVITFPPLDKCPRCGSPKVYQYKKKITLIQTDLKFTSTGIKQHVVEYRASRAKCGNCYLQYNNQNLRKVHYGNNLFAFATNLYISYNISNYMISKIIQEQFGIWVNPMYLVMRKEKWWQQWNPEVDYIWDTIRHSPVIHIDETSIHLDKGNGYVWVFATTTTVFYYYSPTREADFLQDWLKGYQGVIITDFFSAYETIPVHRQKCLIHLIRDLNDDLYKNPFDEEYKAIVIGFNTLLRKIIETIDRYGLQKVHLQKHIQDTEQFLHKYIEPKNKSELSVKCTKRFQKHWEQLWTFLKHDGIPWNNNNAEAAVKAFAQYRRGVKGMIGEHGLREYLKMLSIAQTCRYRSIRFLSFLRYKAGIWQNVPPQVLPDVLPFKQARLYVRKLGFQRKREWIEWSHSDKRPSFIPLTPNSVYKNTGWVDWPDWVGFSFLSFEKARAYMRKLGLKNRDQYWKWLQSGKRPKTIPYSPEMIYKKTGWIDLGDWLGTGNTGQQKKKKLSYDQAKAYVQALGIKTQHEFFTWRSSGERPDTIPTAPERAYYEFEGWGEFLGTGRIANQNKEYWDYVKAKEFLKPLGVRSLTHFRDLCKKGDIPIEIPRNPWAYYRKQGVWIGYADLWGK